MLKLNTRAHLLRNSPWPLLFSLSLGSTLFSLIINKNLYNVLIVLAITGLGWLNEIRCESIFEGAHTNKQNQILYIGFILFLVSEVLIFATLFGSFFYNAINPSIEVYNKYPHLGINPIDYKGLPLINTLLLYFSGLTCTMAVLYINTRKTEKTIKYFILTIILSFIFSFIQYYEYNNTLFTITDGIFASNFYILTGFHGIHVIIGTLFLIYSLSRILDNTTRLNNSVGITSSSLYWHMVDLIWIALYLSLYFWGS